MYITVVTLCVSVHWCFVQVLGKIALDPETEIHRNNNFQNFPSALIVLFRYVQHYLLAL